MTSKRPTRHLREDRLTSRLIWENVRSQIEPSPYGYIVFDDTVLDKNCSHNIELVWRQLTGIEKNQCRKARIQRNHIACAMLVWIRLTNLARKTRQTIYRIKHGLLDDYLCQQLKNPSVKMRFA